CPLDQQILERARWHGRAVEAWPDGIQRRVHCLTIKARLLVFRILSKFVTWAPIPELANSRYLLEQLWLAFRARADLYIAHYPPSLPIAAWAAWLAGSKYAFDFEDLYQGQVPKGKACELPNRLIGVLEARYLPKASLVTAASWGIAREVARLHGG